MKARGVNIAQLSTAEVFASLGVGPSGLSVPEAARRLAQFGPNRIEAVAGEEMPPAAAARLPGEAAGSWRPKRRSASRHG